MYSSSGVPKTIFLSADTDDLCKRLKLLLQKKQDGDNSNMINEGIVAIIDIFLESKWLSKKNNINNI